MRKALLSPVEALSARGLAHVVNITDPDVLVLGGGLSQLPHLYEQLPQLMGAHIFADRASIVIKAPDGVMPAVVGVPPACGIFPLANVNAD